MNYANRVLWGVPALVAALCLAACSGLPQNNSGATGGTGGTVTIGGTVTGLAGTGLVLQNNGGDNLTVTASGTFTFKTAVKAGAAYAVTVLTQPSTPSQNCVITSGTGTASANVTSVAVACTTAAVSAKIGGSVTGLTVPSSGLVLQDNGGDSLTITANGTFTFRTAVTGTGAYAVTVLTQPTTPNQLCSVTNGSGTATADVTNVAVNCVLAYTISGTVNGLVGTGMVLQDNGSDSLSITSANASSFTFKNLIPTGGAYAVSIVTQPSNPTQACKFSGSTATGTATANVSNVTINCPAVTYSVGGVVVGLQGKTPTPPTQINLPLTDNSFVLQNNIGDNLTVSQNGPFTFATPVALNGAYDVEVFTGPSTQPQACWNFGFKGVVTGNVTGITVDCGHNDWEWIGGVKISGTISAPQYGSFPTAAPATIPNPYTNTPGARTGGAGWTDNSGNLWLFGGKGWELSGNPSPDTLFGTLNDLWECQIVNADTPHCQWQLVNGYDPTVGTTIQARAQHENNSAQTSGNALLVVPTSRWGAATWTDLAGTKFWLFGGNGNGTQLLNDVWVFDTTTTQWTFKSGSANGGNIGGTYTGSPYPGSRWGSVTWVDGSGNFWLFGGYGYDGSANVGFLNDLWKFNGTTWTFVAGSQTINQNGVYTGTPYPGGRQQGVGWVDASGNLWMFGGEGEDASGTANGILNDLWKYNIAGNTWSFIAGSMTANQTGNYGNQPLIGPQSTTGAAGTVGLTGATPGLFPGSRWGASAWTDATGNLWLYGGWGLDSTGTNGNGALNDLWAFDTTTGTWTWVKGSITGDQNGIYGSLTRPYAPFVGYGPGGRNGATSWVDKNNQLWLFGGQGYDSSSASGNGFLNDLWRYVPYQ